MRLTNSWSAAALGICALAACGEARDVVGFTGAQSSCASCHSAPDEDPPFRRANGQVEPAPTGGSHDRHIGGGVTVPIDCSECHVVPRSVAEHVDGQATVIFGPLARTGGQEPTSCGTTYCHGGFPGGNVNAPAWFAARPPNETCGTCHSLPPPTGLHEFHVGREYGTGTPRPTITCTECHGAVLQVTHVNGVKNVVTNDLLQAYDPVTATCSSVACHPGNFTGAGWRR